MELQENWGCRPPKVGCAMSIKDESGSKLQVYYLLVKMNRI